MSGPPPQNPQYPPQQQYPPNSPNPYPMQYQPQQTGYPMYPPVQQSTATVNYPPQQQYPQQSPQNQPPPQQYQPPPQQYQSPPPQQYQPPPQQYQPPPQQYQSPPPQQYQSPPPQNPPPQSAPTFHTYRTELYVAKTGVPGVYNLPQPSAPPQQKKSSGFSITGMLKAVESGINSVTHEIDKSLSHYVDPKASDSRFRSRFWLPQQEGLVWELPAKGVTVDNVYPGQIYLSHNYFSFFCEFNGKKSAVLIPLRDIVAIQKAMLGRTLKESQPNIVPYNPHENKLVEQWVIEIYTNIGTVHQFYSIPDYDVVYNSLYTTWMQSNKTNPLPMPVQPAPQHHHQPQPYPQPQPQPYPQPVYTTTTTTTVIKK